MRSSRKDATQIYEKARGKTTKGRRELEKAIASLGTGDVWCWQKWDRCTRSMIDSIAIMERIAAGGAFVKVLDRAHLDLMTPIGPAFPR